MKSLITITLLPFPRELIQGCFVASFFSSPAPISLKKEQMIRDATTFEGGNDKPFPKLQFWVFTDSILGVDRHGVWRIIAFEEDDPSGKKLFSDNVWACMYMGNWPWLMFDFEERRRWYVNGNFHPFSLSFDHSRDKFFN